MIFVYLWIPFIIAAMCCGVAAATGRFQEGADPRIRLDRLALLVGFMGPLLLVLLAIERLEHLGRAWLLREPELSKELQFAGAKTHADLDRMALEVKAGTRPCFLPSHRCGICGETVTHRSQHPLPVFFRSLTDERLQVIFESLTQVERGQLLQAMFEAKDLP